jgi:hypothetical protein
MDEVPKKIFNSVGIQFSNMSELNGLWIEREQLLNFQKYEDVRKLIPELKTMFTSSTMTSLQQNAGKEQRWPLLNLVRQILSYYNFHMEPIRKADGYTPDGVKKYKRFFVIRLKNNSSVTDIEDTF